MSKGVWKDFLEKAQQPFQAEETMRAWAGFFENEPLGVN